MKRSLLAILAAVSAIPVARGDFIYHEQLRSTVAYSDSTDAGQHTYEETSDHYPDLGVRNVHLTAVSALVTARAEQDSDLAPMRMETTMLMVAPGMRDTLLNQTGLSVSWAYFGIRFTVQSDAPSWWISTDFSYSRRGIVSLERNGIEIARWPGDSRNFHFRNFPVDDAEYHLVASVHIGSPTLGDLASGYVTSGLHLAVGVPAPGSFAVVALGCIWSIRRRRNG